MTNSPLPPVPRASLNRVLRLIDELHRAAATVGTLSSGGSSTTALPLAGGGRLGDKTIVTRRWTGPHRQTFDSLIANEMLAATGAKRALTAEAEAWRRWVIANSET